MLSTELLQEIRREEGDREERHTTSNVSWQAYEALLVKTGDRAGQRIAYLDGILEIMSPSRRHEGEKKRIATLLEAYFEQTDTEYFPFGSTTLRRKEKKGGVEPDESYCIGAEKEVPDLAIEVVVTSGGADKLEIYRRLRVKEAWFWQDEGFAIFCLQGDRYQESDRSELLPDLDFNVFAQWVRHPSSLEAVKRFRRSLDASRPNRCEDK